MNTIIEIKLSDIVLSGKNPRKSFSENGLNELAHSIRINGLINPITVRKKGKKYELIAGERRYKASKIAKLKTIDATLVDVDDEDAYRIMLVENLQREDVHPMEEAQAFQELLGKGVMSLEDLANDLGRSQKYITNRLILSDLIPEIADAYRQGLLSLSTAMAIARVSPDDQQKVFAQYYEEEPWQGYPTHKQIQSFIEGRLLKQISQAPFDPEDTELYPEAGPCTTCPKRSGNNPLLFDDIEEDDVCFDGMCFQIKINNHFHQSLEKALTDPNMYLLWASYGEDPPEEYVEMAKSAQAKILTESDYSRWDEEGTVKVSGFMLNGYDKGSVKEVYLKGKAADKIAAESEDTPPEKLMEMEIQKATDLEHRRTELDREKIFQATWDIMSDKSFPTGPDDKPGKDENLILIAIWYTLLQGVSYGITKSLLASVDPEKNYTETLDVINDHWERDPEFWMSLIRPAARVYIQDRYFSSSMQDKTKHTPALLYETLCEFWFNKEYAQVVKDQMAIRAERKEKFKTKIDQIKQKYS